MSAYPLLLFVYNRPVHVQRTLDALSRNRGADQTDLVVYSDGPRTDSDRDKVNQVRAICHRIKGFRSVRVVERETNLGLATSIITGVSEVLETAEAVMVMEDDLVTSPYFISYLRQALKRYRDAEDMLSVSAYVPPRWRMKRGPDVPDVWLSKRHMSFGWGTWKEKWAGVQWDRAQRDGFDSDPALQAAFAEAGGDDLPGMLCDQMAGRIDSWAIRFTYDHFRRGMYSLLPADTYVKPVGFDGSGLNCRPNPLRWFETTRHARSEPQLPEQPEVHAEAQAALKAFFDRHHRMVRVARSFVRSCS